MYFIVPEHLQGAKRGFKVSFSSERQILQRGKPVLPIEASLISIGFWFSDKVGTITFFEAFYLTGLPSDSTPILIA